MIRQLRSNRSAPSLAYAAMNTAVWVIYAALVLLVPQMLSNPNPGVVTASVLVAAIALHPLRRRASGAARRRFHDQSLHGPNATAGSYRSYKHPGQRRPTASS